LGGNEIIQVNNDIDLYSIGIVPPWCTVQKFDKYFTIICKKNISDSERSGTITIVASNKSAAIKVHQKKFDPESRIKTVLPKNIKGSMKFCGIPKSKQTYEIVGGILGAGANEWCLYLGNKIITRFSGNTFQFIPTITSSYVIAPDNNPNLKFSFTVEIVDFIPSNISIAAPSTVCSRQPFTMVLQTLEADSILKWKWYRKSGDLSEQDKYLGSNRTIIDSIEKSSEYYVKIEYKNCPLSNSMNHFVTAHPTPIMPTTSYSYTDNIKDKVNLEARIPNMELTNWEWSLDKFNSVFSDSNALKNIKLAKDSNDFYVRYYDRCGIISPYTSLTIIRKKYDYIFVNAGFNFFNTKSFGSFNLTLGNKNLYIRGKISIASILSSSYSYEFSGKNMFINDQSRVLNFPPNTGSYYIVNGKQAISRTSITSGIIYGTNSLKIYAGAGYGKSSILWGLNLINYTTGNLTSRTWAINNDQSSNGLEIETGFFIKKGQFNIMPGISWVKSKNQKNPYLEFNIGLGFSNK
jgi:hypothetical protein